MQVEAQGAVHAVDLEGLERLVTAGVAGTLEQAHRAVLEAAKEHAGVVDGDGRPGPGSLVDPFLDEGLGLGHHLDDRAVQPHRRVDAMRQQIAGDAGAGDGGIEAPEPFAALRQVLAHRPVLEELRPIVKGAADPALVDELPCQRHRGQAAVVVEYHVGNAGLLDGCDHRLALGHVEGERLFGHDPLAGLGGGDGDLLVGVVGRADVDKVDVVAGDECPPVGLGAGVAPVVGEGLRLAGTSGADGLKDGFIRQIEETGRLPPGVAVRPPHETAADRADAQGFLCHRCRLPCPQAGLTQVPPCFDDSMAAAMKRTPSSPSCTVGARRAPGSGARPSIRAAISSAASA